MTFWSLTWSEALQRGNFAAIADWFIGYFFLFGIVALLLAGGAAWVECDFAMGLRVLVLGALLAAASTVCGWLLGLLFGVPRSLARPQPAASPAAATDSQAAALAATRAATSRVNTNLEDISDWLTKTIVGVGLTQLFAVPVHLWNMAGKLNEGGFLWIPHGQLLALVLILYFAPGGFWLGYVGTRTILTRLFDHIDGFNPQQIEAAADPQNLRLDASAKRIEGANPQIAGIDRILLATPMHMLQSPRELAAWGAAKARAGDLQSAATALQQAVKSEPLNSDFKEQLATIYAALNRPDEASELVQDVPDSEIAVFRTLYKPPPRGFRRAIAIGEQLLQRPNTKPSASLRTWLAAAYGQQYGYEKQQGADDKALAAIKENAMREIRAALALDSSTRELFHSMWHPAAGQEDDDLSGFAPDDPELVQLLGR